MFAILGRGLVRNGLNPGHFKFGIQITTVLVIWVKPNKAGQFMIWQDFQYTFHSLLSTQSRVDFIKVISCKAILRLTP